MKSNILILGDLIVDHYISGESTRLSPEAPIPIVNKQSEEYILGGAGNVAKNIFKLQQNKQSKNCKLFGIFLDFDNADLKTELQSFGEIYFINDDLKVSKKTRIISNNKQIVRIDEENVFDISLQNQNRVLQQFDEIVNYNEISCVVLSDYNKGFLTKNICSYIIKECNKKNILVLVDPKSDYLKYKNATLLTPNLKELKSIISSFGEKHENLLTSLELLVTELNIKYPLVTLSENGISALIDFEVKNFKSEAKEIYDVTGAGDTVIAVLAVMMSSGKSLQQSITLANKAASIVISKKERFITSEEITEKIIFTNGCFDLLHQGHLELLKYCKTLGKVIVGLNSDDSVKMLKGSERPINSQEFRKEILQSLKFVDEVIIFSEDTPYNLIKQINPDIIVKGSDYTKSEVIGNDIAEVKLFNLNKGLSSTNIINKIKELR